MSRDPAHSTAREALVYSPMRINLRRKSGEGRASDHWAPRAGLGVCRGTHHRSLVVLQGTSQHTARYGAAKAGVPVPSILGEGDIVGRRGSSRKRGASVRVRPRGEEGLGPVRWAFVSRVGGRLSLLCEIQGSTVGGGEKQLSPSSSGSRVLSSTAALLRNALTVTTPAELLEAPTA